MASTVTLNRKVDASDIRQGHGGSVMNSQRQSSKSMYTVSPKNMRTIKDRLMAIDCLFLGIEEMVERGTIDESDLEILRAIAQRGRHLEGEAMDALPNGGDL